MVLVRMVTVTRVSVARPPSRSYLNFHQTMIPADGSVSLSLSRFGVRACRLCVCAPALGGFFSLLRFRAFTRVRVFTLTSKDF